MTDAPGSGACGFRGSTTRPVRDAQRRWPLVRGWCARPPRVVVYVPQESHCCRAASAQQVVPQRLGRWSISHFQPVFPLRPPLFAQQSP